MLRLSTFCTRRTVTALTLVLLPSALAAQGGAPAAAAQPAAAPQATISALDRVPGAAVAPDPWVAVFGRDARRTARANVARLDVALDRYQLTYARLSAEDRERLHWAFDNLLPRERFTRYSLNDVQAQAIAYLALGPWERRGRGGWHGRDDDDGYGDRPGRDERPSRPWPWASAVDSASRDAAWIHSTVLAMGRPANRRARNEERATLADVAERARAIAITVSRCGCGEARDDAEKLYVGTRELLDVYDASSMPAWMSLGDSRVQRVAQLADSVERALLRALGDAR